MKMKSILLMSLMSVAMILSFASCNPKQSALDDFQTFTEDLEQSYSTYTNEQWDNSMSRYNEIIQNLELYKQEYSSQEKESIGKLQGRCELIFTKHAIKDGVDSFMNDFYKYKGILEGVLEGLQDIVK